MRRMSALLCLVLIVCVITAVPAGTRAAEDPTDRETNLTLEEALKGTQLTDEEKKWLKEQEKYLMKQAAEMITAGMEEDAKLTAIVKYTIANVKNWSAFAGQASAGDYREVMNLAGEVAARQLHEYVKDKLPEGKIKGAYEFFVDNALEGGKAVAIAMMNPNKSWADIGEVMWTHTTSGVKKGLEGKAEELPSTLINYAFGDKKVLGYMPGDLYVLLLKTEMQVIEVWSARYVMSKQDELYASYQNTRLRGDNHAAAFAAVSDELVRGPYAMAFGRVTSPEAVAALFEERYLENRNATEIGLWLRAKLREKASEEKQNMDAEKVMDKVRTRLQADLTSWFNKMREKKEELMEKEMLALLKQKRDAAVKEAKQQRDLLLRATKQAKAYCEKYEAGEEKLKKLYEDLRVLETEIKNLPALLAHAKKAQDYARDTRKLHDITANLERLFKDLELTVDEAGDSGTRACRYYEQISKAQTRQQGLVLVNQTITEGRNASSRASAAEAKANRLKQVQSEATNTAKNFIQTYTAKNVQDMQEALNRIKALVEKIDGAKADGYPRDIKAAINELSECVFKSNNLIEYATGLKAQIKKTLDPFPSNKSIREINESIDAALSDASPCAKQIKYTYETGGSRWGKRQIPQSPSIDPTIKKQAKSALTSPSDFKGMNPTDAVTRIIDVREKTQARMAELELAKRTYEKCISLAIGLQQRRINLGRIQMSVKCDPSTAPAGIRVQCVAKIDDPAALKNLNSLPSVGGRWGYYWYINNVAQSSTGSAISVMIPKEGAQVVARLMVINPTDANPGPDVSYDMDYSTRPPRSSEPKAPELKEAARASATLQAQAAPQQQKPPVAKTEPTRKKYGPFAVSWGAWVPTGIAIKKGESFSVKATGAYISTNQNTDVKTCGPGGCGPWGWFVLKAKIGNQIKDVGSSGGGIADKDGTIELGSPRGGEFRAEDAGNCTGSLSAEVWVDEKSGPR